jgi:hypothetical protein
VLLSAEGESDRTSVVSNLESPVVRNIDLTDLLSELPAVVIEKKNCKFNP